MKLNKMRLLGLKKKNKAKGITISDFKIYCKAMVIKLYGTGTRIGIYSPLEQNRDPINKPMITWSIVYHKGGKKYTMRERQSFQ